MAHTRRSSIAGFVLAAAGLTILGSHGPVAGAAQTGNGNADAKAGGALSITMTDSDVAFGSTAAMLPGETASETGALAMTVLSNNGGYVLNVAASDFVHQSDATKTFAASALSIGGVTMSNSAQQVATGVKNNPTGTDHSLDASLTMPWADPGDYSSTLTFTVASS